VFKAQQTGEGESIDLSMYETLLRIGAYYMVDYLNDGTTYPRPGAGHQNLCGIGEYKCADGFIGLCLYGVKQNEYLLKTIGLGYLWGTEDYPTDTSGLWLSSPKAGLIEEKLKEYLSTRKVADVEQDFSEHAIAAGAVLEFDQILEEEHYKLREDFVEWDTVDGRRVKGIGIFPKFAKAPGQIWRPMPSLGMDTEDVLTRAGYTPAQLQELEDAKIIRRG
jgi:L-carnitine CoA-transferase